MTRRRFIQIDGELVEVTPDYTPEPRGPFVMGEIPDYTSPVDGKVISGRAQRREDMRRNGCRPWEGRDQEVKEAQRQKQYQDQHLEQRLHENVMRSYHELPPEKRRILRGS